MSKYLEQWTLAWLLACAVFALHLVDEGLNGTFGFYSDLERLFTQLLPSLNFTPFNFNVWLLNMTGTLVVLFALTPLVAARNALMVPASWAFAAFLTGNSAFHLLMSASRGEPVTGALSSPLMLAAGLFLFVSAARVSRAEAAEGA